MDFPRCLIYSASRQEQEGPAVYPAKIKVVIYRGKQLVCKDSWINAVNLCAKELPAELYVMIAKKFVRVGRQGRIFLVQLCRCRRVAKSHAGKTAEKVGKAATRRTGVWRREGL